MSSDGSGSPAMRSAKIPRTALAGPYGHPFHPIAVTVPIGAWIASLVFDVIGLFAEDPEMYAVGARVLVIIGIVGAVVAAVLGLMDFSRIPKKTRAWRTALVHMVLNLVVVVLFAIGLVIRFAVGEEISGWAIAVSVVALAGLGVSGWLGGDLAYRWGVRVADESTQRDGFEVA